MGIRPVSASAGDGHFERTHAGVRMLAQLDAARLETRRTVESEYRVDVRIAQASCLDHVLAAGTALFSGLEDELHIPGDILAHPGQQFGDPELNCHMPVMPAGVHNSRRLRCELQTRFLLNGQRVHIRTPRHSPTRLAAPQQADDARACDFGLHVVQPQRPQPVGHDAGCAELLEAQFWMRMDVMANTAGAIDKRLADLDYG